MSLKNLLSMEYRQLGLELEGDDHCLWIKDRSGKVVLAFTVSTTEQEITRAVEKYLHPEASPRE